MALMRIRAKSRNEMSGGGTVGIIMKSLTRVRIHGEERRGLDRHARTRALKLGKARSLPGPFPVYLFFNLRKKHRSPMHEYSGTARNPFQY